MHIKYIFINRPYDSKDDDDNNNNNNNNRHVCSQCELELLELK